MIHFIDRVVEPWMWSLADWSVRWAVLIGLLAAVLHWGRLRRTATRYLLCAVVLCVGLLLPALPRWGPGLWSSEQDARLAQGATLAATGDAAAIAPTALAGTPTEPQSSLAGFAPAAQESDVARASARPPERVESQRLGVRRIALVALAAVWSARVAVFLLRLAGGWLVLARIRRRAIPVGDGAGELFDDCRRQLGLRRRAALAMHPAVASPITVGPWRPVVLVPAGWEQLPAATQRSSIVHELWHVRRRDDWTGLAVELVRATFFFHPLVHWLVGRLYRERELLCDEAAVTHGADARDYARMLLDFARRPTLHPLADRTHGIATVPTTPLGDRRTVKHRIDHLLDENAARWMVPLPRGRATALVLVTMAMTLGMAGLRVRGTTGAATIATRSGLVPTADELAADSGPGPAAEALQQRPQVVAVLGDTRLSHWNSVTSLAYSPDGGTLATSSIDHTVVLWDMASGNELHTLRHGGSVSDVAFSPDGKTLATGVSDWGRQSAGEPAAKLWDVESGAEKTTITHHEPRFRTPRNLFARVAFSPDGHRLATGGSGVVKLWDLATQQQLFSVDAHVDNGVHWAIQDLAFSPDGALLASASSRRNPEADVEDVFNNSEGVVKLWQVSSGQELAVLGGHARSVGAIAFSGDSKRLAAADYAGTIRIWDLDSQKVTRELFGPEYRVGALAISSDGALLASGGADQKVWIWDAKTGTRLRTIEGITGEIRAVAFKPDSYVLAVASQDKRVRRWNAETGDEIAPMAMPVSWPVSLAFSPDGKTLALGERHGAIRLWDVSGKRTLRAFEAHSDWVSSLAFRPDGALVSRSARARISPDGEFVATVRDDGVLEIQDAASGEALRTIRTKSGRVGSMSFSADGTRIAVSEREMVSVWSTATGKLLRTAKNPDHVDAVALNPDGTVLAAAGRDDDQGQRVRYATIVLWNVETGERMTALRGPRSYYLHCVAFSANGTTLATAGWDGTLWLWNVADGSLRTTLSLGPPGGRIHEAAFSRDGRHLATINGNGTVSIVRLTE